MIAQFKGICWKTAVLTMLLSLVGVSIALAAAGDLDGTFGAGGMVNTDIEASWNDTIRAIALQSDGKIVAVGVRSDPADGTTVARDIAMARYEDDGDVDPTYIEGGKFHVDLGGYDEAVDVKLAADDMVVVSGHRCEPGGGNCDIVVARIGTGGEIDPAFNGGNEKYIDYAGEDNGSMGGLAVMPDGRIVIAGRVLHGGTYDFAVYRLTPGGAMDTTFSGDGKVRLNFGAGRYDVPSDLVLMGSKIVVAGNTCDAGHVNCDFAVARLTSSGVLDTTFSGDGKLTTDFGAEETAYAVARDPNGKIVVAGGSQSSSYNAKMAVARYNLNGSLDATFSRDGKRTVRVGLLSIAMDVLVQGVGKIVLAGPGFNGTDFDMAVVRLRPAGGYDPSFGTDGIKVIDFGHTEVAFALERQSDGKYLVAGMIDDGAQDDFALARLMP